MPTPGHSGGYGSLASSVVSSASFKAEAAPFEGRAYDFLTYYSWPEDDAGVPLRWTDLPVLDLVWNKRRDDHCGFIQEPTGWKPSPLQQTMDVAAIAAATGLPGPRLVEVAS